MKTEYYINILKNNGIDIEEKDDCFCEKNMNQENIAKIEMQDGKWDLVVIARGVKKVVTTLCEKKEAIEYFFLYLIKRRIVNRKILKTRREYISSLQNAKSPIDFISILKDSNILKFVYKESLKYRVEYNLREGQYEVWVLGSNEEKVCKSKKILNETDFFIIFLNWTLCIDNVYDFCINNKCYAFIDTIMLFMLDPKK